MLMLGGKASTFEEGRTTLSGLIENGEAFAKFKQFISTQGGDAIIADQPDQLPGAKRIIPVEAPAGGFISKMAAESIGVAAMMLGAGRATKESTIDLGVGIMLRKKSGDPVAKGESLADLYVNDTSEAELAEVIQKVQQAFSISDSKPEALPLIYAVVTKHGVERM